MRHFDTFNEDNRKVTCFWLAHITSLDLLENASLGKRVFPYDPETTGCKLDCESA